MKNANTRDKNQNYSKEDLIKMRIASEEIGARSIPFFGFLIITVICASISAGILVNPGFGGTLFLIIMGMTGFLAVGSGALTVIYGLIYLAFLMTEKYRVCREPASLYKKATIGLTKDQLLEIHYAARARMKTPLGVNIAKNLSMPNVPLATGANVDPAHNANSMFDQNKNNLI